jgi:HK97 gp10 family phage protein
VSVSVELRGLQELDEKLLLLGKVGGQKAIRQALYFASKPILDRAKANIQAWPGGSGALHAAMGRTFRVERAGEGGKFAVLIGPRPAVRLAVSLHNLAYERRRSAIFYGHFLEFGHQIVRRKATGAVNRHGKAKYLRQGLGKVMPQRFLGPALESGSLRAVFAFQQQLRRRVERALRKMNPEAENA